MQLTPEDKQVAKECEKELKDAKEYVRKLQVVSINNKEKEDGPEEMDTSINLYEGNQKLRLCEALLLVGDWNTAQVLIKRLPDKFAVNYEPIANALCSLLHTIIEPVYKE